VLNPDEVRLIWTLPCAWALAATGALAGLVSGLLGVGGGLCLQQAFAVMCSLVSLLLLARGLELGV
jgi:uncharacterized membrane protein YfcA